MAPPTNRFSKSLALSSLIGLGAGAVLGYQWKSGPALPAAGAPPSSITVSEGGQDSPAKGAVPASPYDVQSVIAGGSQPLAEFEAWLASASCDEVTRLMLHPTVNGPQPHPPMCALLVSRYREFSVEDRFNNLQKQLSGETKLRNFGLIDIFSDLARDTLPQRAFEMRELFKKRADIMPSKIGMALADWAARDFGAAAAFAGQIEGNDNEVILTSMIGKLAEKDLALAQREALKVGKGQEEAVRTVAYRMARKDLASALDWLNSTGQAGSDHYGQGWPYQSAVRAACAVDNAAVAKLILDRPGLFEGEGGPELVGEVFKSWAARDSAAAEAWLATHPMPELHQKAALKQVDEARWRGLPLEEAMAGVRTLPEEERAARARLLAARMVADDPANAAAHFASLLPEGGMKGNVAETFMHQLPDEFLAQAVRQFPGVLEDINEHGSLMDRLTRLEEAPLAELLPHLPEAARNQLREKVLQSALTTDPERALAMVAGMKRETLDPFTGSSLAVHMAASDPEKAAGWVADFEEGPGKEWAALNLVSNWAKYDPDAAVAWLENLPPGRSRDRAAFEAVKIQGSTGNHQAALTLAAGLGDAGERAEATGFALQQLWRRDPVSGAAALLGSGLPEEQRTGIAKKLSDGGFAP